MWYRGITLRRVRREVTTATCLLPSYSRGNMILLLPVFRCSLLSCSGIGTEGFQTRCPGSLSMGALRGKDGYALTTS